MNPLPGSPEPPEQLRSKYSDWDWQVAWQHCPEALTYRLRSELAGRFLKLAPTGHHPSLRDEADRMAWAASHLPVPQVVEFGSNGTLAWLVTTALPGIDATDPTLKAEPTRLVPVLAAGLRRFHNAPVADCPFDFRRPAALHHVRERLARGLIDPKRHFHPEFSHLTAEEAVDWLERSLPPSEDLAVCHGDYCLPNVLIHDGVVSGFVDLGELGVADRWWDLSVATWSLGWNLGPGYEELFLEVYGAQPDPDRLQVYRLLYDLAS